MNSSLVRPLQFLFAILVMAFLALPWFFLLIASLTDAAFIGSRRGSFSFRWFEAVLTDSAWWQSSATSGLVTVVAATIATIVATSVAIELYTRRAMIRLAVGILFLAPLIVPAIILALGLRSLYWNTLPSTSLIVIGGSLLGIPVVYLLVSAALWTMNPRQIWAAQSLGCSRAMLTRRVIFPHCMTAACLGWLMSAFLVFDDVVFALFLGRPHNHTLARAVWETARHDATPEVAAVSVLWLGGAVGLAALLLVASPIMHNLQHQGRSRNG